ncbi:bifunctional DNA primase/polymerase [Dictyobacter aurantiacus]|uniref:DNA primase/polymerase bifunctional N-terminal domain-containing protein n=1 Tax=Dictyobacter aurantiacus TaxID=1936993 RepID=A0A401ZGY3_9CHLR|nr:bifunctional DNA primase/polymerase [Dictyobacter aurantiacus]GCE06127.1 hypothetical protein KDAU_34560 [Dictyobacter aurantiacus]
MTIVPLSTAWTEQAPFQTAREAAQRYGWSVLPLGADKRPPAVGGAHADGTPKRLAWKAFQKRRASAQEITHWEHQYAPAAWGVITGELSKVLILDFDGLEGQQTLGQLGLDPHVRTGSGGYHVYFHHPGWPVPTINSKTTHELGRSWPGLDIRADGGYAAFCGRSASGPYTWLRDPEPEALTCLPEDLRAFLGLLAARGEVPLETQRTGSVLGQTLVQRALRMVQIDKKGRNDTGFWLACQLRDNGFPREAAKQALQNYSEQVPATNTKGHAEPYTREEAFASLESAYQEAARSPWSELATASHGGSRGGGTVKVAMGSPSGPASLPEIVIGGDQLRDLTDQAIAAIQAQERHHPTLFLQSARLVRIARDETQRPIIAQMGVNEVKEVLTHSANYFRLKKAAGTDLWQKIPTSPPKELAEQILARQTQKPYLPFPALAAIVETPVMRPDGTILDQPGYDAKTKLYYAPQEGMRACTVPASPTREERDAALALIMDAIGQFAYVEQADKANALGLCLTPLVRPAIKRHVPLALIDAPKQGSGKGLYSDVVSTIATGNSAAILTLSDSDEELQKTITSLLVEGATIVTIDNITGQLQSRHLDAVLTSDMWRGRILGQSKMTYVPQRATWLATGNNIKIGGDLGRRCYRIRFDPKTSRPWLRTGFKHSDLITWVLEHRSELIAALLTLARAWYVAGCPQYDHIPALGTFTGWSKTIGGILEYAGVQGFLSNLARLYDEADEENAQWDTFFQAWIAQFGSEWVTTATLNEHLGAASGPDDKSDGPLANALPEYLQITLKERPKSFKASFSKALERRVDECFGDDNLRLEKKRDKHRNINNWRILRGVAEVLQATCEKKNSDNFSAKLECVKSDREDLRHPSQIDDSDEAQNSPIGSAGAPSTQPSLNEEPENPQSASGSLASTEEWEEFDL